MKRLYRILKIAIASFIGVFIGSSIYEYYDYKTHPDLYEAWSAPWYLKIEMRGIATILIVAVICIIMILIKKKIKSNNF